MGDRRADRAERCGEDDVLQLPDGNLQTGPGPGSVPGAEHLGTPGSPPGRARVRTDVAEPRRRAHAHGPDRKSTRLNSSHRCISYAVFCLKKKTKIRTNLDADPRASQSFALRPNDARRKGHPRLAHSIIREFRFSLHRATPGQSVAT